MVFVKKRLIWVLLAVFILADALLLLFTPLVPISPNVSLLPTAEYLLENPAPKPEFISFPEFQFSADCAMNISFGQYIPTNANLKDYFILTIDGIEVQYSPYLLRSYGGALSCRGQFPDLVCWDGGMFCYAKAGLNDGLHLAELTLTDLSGQQHSYQWAFTSVPPTTTPTP